MGDMVSRSCINVLDNAGDDERRLRSVCTDVAAPVRVEMLLEDQLCYKVLTTLAPQQHAPSLDPSSCPSIICIPFKYSDLYRSESWTHNEARAARPATGSIRAEESRLVKLTGAYEAVSGRSERVSQLTLKVVVSETRDVLGWLGVARGRADLCGGSRTGVPGVDVCCRFC